MELLESLLVNKKNFIILASIYIVIVVIVLILIWKPDKVSDIAYYEPYDEIAKNEEMIRYYVTFLEDMKIYSSAEDMSNYIDHSYLQYTGMTIEEAANMLKSTEHRYTLQNFKTYDAGEKFIYSISLPKGNEKLDVNIVEDKYPYNCHITYGTFVSYSDSLYYGNLEGTELKVLSTYRDLNYIEYELEITNKDTEKLTFDLSNADNCYLKLGNNSSSYLNLVKSTQGPVVVEQGQTERIKLAFNVSIIGQDSIESLNIKKVLKGTNRVSATVSF